MYVAEKSVWFKKQKIQVYIKSIKENNGELNCCVHDFSVAKNGVKIQKKQKKKYIVHNRFYY